MEDTGAVNRETKRDGTPRIYVVSLSDYDAGRLLGRWIDADQPVQAIREQIVEMLAESKEPPAGTWAIHDYENFAGLNLSECPDIYYVAEVAFLISEHGPVFAHLVDHFGGGPSGLEDAKRWMAEGYRGAFDSLTDYVEELIEDCYGDVLKGLPDFIRYHIDFESIADDMELSGDVFTIEHGGQVHVFDGQI